jgi:hypothetical protein
MGKKKKPKQEEEIEEIEEALEQPNLKHYVDNAKFCREMSEWKKLVRDAEQADEKRPPVTDYIAECFLQIAEHLSYRPNFINYPFREDMVGDGIENCLLYAHNFDPKKSKNPFSYFTQIIYYAFLRRIEKEKKQSFIKYKSLQMNDMDGKFVDWLKENQGSSTYSEFIQKTFSLTEQDIKNMEPKKRKKRKKKNKSKSNRLFE